MRRSRHVPALLGMLLCTASAWAAQPSPPPQPLGKGPIHITADNLVVVNKPKQQAVYTGNVRLVQGDVDIRADRLVIDAVQGKMDKATATGSPVAFTMSSADRRGEGQTLVYMPDRGEIVITGDAHLWQGKNEVTGSAITYFLQDQKTTVSGATGQRVKSVFYPATAPTASAPKGQAAQ